MAMVGFKLQDIKIQNPTENHYPLPYTVFIQFIHRLIIDSIMFCWYLFSLLLASCWSWHSSCSLYLTMWILMPVNAWSWWFLAIFVGFLNRNKVHRQLRSPLLLLQSLRQHQDLRWHPSHRKDGRLRLENQLPLMLLLRHRKRSVIYLVIWNCLRPF